jgi:hypothetical protein
MNTKLMIPFKTTRAVHVQNGFALVVTLSLMMLLTVIAVGLLTLSGISLRSSTQGQAAAEAGANARLALMMAIGELQKEMGPDSRISAPRDAGTTATGGQPRWTAVYEAWQRPANPATPESPDLRVPKFRGWLASGANQATGGPAGTADKALLVGANSLGGAATADDEVRVPMHGVSTGRHRGRLAWWTADEATKAKVNAGPDSSTLAAGLSNSFFDAQAPANVGHRALPKLEQFDWKDGQRAKTLSTAQVNLATGLVSPAGVGNLSHDLTVHSAGVLADVPAGRLKRDLSNLLARPIAELRDKPLYLSDGRMNRFDIAGDGAKITNQGFVKSWKSSANTRDEWGINLEELHLFHNIHRELTWSGSTPGLVGKTTRETVINDPYYLYKRPVIEAVQFILSLKAVPSGSSGSPATPSYKMQMMLDAMVAVSNPNDVAIEYAKGLPFVVQLFSVPYNVKWNISKAAGGSLTTTSQPGDELDIFRGYVGGGATNSAQAGGIKLEPGEVGVFGSSNATGYVLDLQRGFQPSGGVTMTGWDLKATNLKAEDKVDFEIQKVTSPSNVSGGQYYSYYALWLGRRDHSGNKKGWQIDAVNLRGGGDIDSGLMSELLQSPIKPPEVRKVSDFITPQPVLMFSYAQNVEQSSGSTPPDAFASRPFLLNEPTVSGNNMSPSTMASDRHATQILVTGEPMNFQFRTLAAGEGGRFVYSGGGRQPNLGGSFNVVKRRIPVAPPLSLGAFENAIASGFCGHFYEGAAPAIKEDPYPTNLNSAAALTGHRFGWPLAAKAIGNSFSTPFLAPGQVAQTTGKSVTDHSWMANTALWDSWFLSGIVDGTGTGSSPLMKDSRSPRAQFKELAEGKGMLRNKRYVFHPSKSPATALTELFSGENFKPSAINSLTKYLLVDGAFNVNSTSSNAWAALLSSVRDQELLTANGSTQKFDYPFGTLGLAVNTATSGTAGDWTGLRSLTVDEIKTLATAIAAEVKSRGPFLSLADFVNRRPDSSDPSQQALGALQSAIDKSGLNDRFTGGGRSADSADFDPLAGKAAVGMEPKPARAVGSAGHLRQAALLTAFGSQITVRSDTFIIRAYGDARDASGTKIIAKAWCEAVIQRVPDYIDPTDAPEAQEGWPQTSSKLTPVNTRFGRRLEVQSFRWLGSNEI